MSKEEQETALNFFLKKYPNSNEKIFNEVATLWLQDDYPNVDPKNLSSEQEERLIDFFQKTSEEEIMDLVYGILMKKYGA